MAQNFRLSILSHKRQSYDLSQFSEINTPLPLDDVDMIQNNLLPEEETGTSQHLQHASTTANNHLHEPLAIAKKSSIQEISSKNPEKTPKDFWLCIGLMSVFTLIAIAGILIVILGVDHERKENYYPNENSTTTIIRSEVSSKSTTEMDYDTTTDIIVPSSMDLNETQMNN